MTEKIQLCHSFEITTKYIFQSYKKIESLDEYIMMLRNITSGANSYRCINVSTKVAADTERFKFAPHGKRAARNRHHDSSSSSLLVHSSRPLCYLKVTPPPPPLAARQTYCINQCIHNVITAPLREENLLLPKLPTCNSPSPRQPLP